MRLPDRLDPREGIDKTQPVSNWLRERVLRALGVRDFSYFPAEIVVRRAFRRVFPVPTSPWTNEPVEDKSVINLVPPQRLRPFFAEMIRTLKQLRGDAGDYLEFGVFNGSSMSSMMQASADEKAQMRYFGFDAFEGLPPGVENEDDGVWEPGFYQCSFDEMKKSMEKKVPIRMKLYGLMVGTMKH